MSPVNSIEINYDKDNDVLYAIDNRCERDKTFNIEINENVIARIDPSTKKLVGLTIENFSHVRPEWANQSNYILMEKFDEFILNLNTFHVVPCSHS